MSPPIHLLTTQEHTMATPTTAVPSREMALNAQQIDFRSDIRQRDYRLMVSIPNKPAPKEGYPVVYLIDGNLHFGIAVDTMRIQACWPDTRDAVIVGIGYPTDRVADALTLRMDDLTTPLQESLANTPWYRKMPPPPNGYGKMDDYLRMIDEEVKPRVAEIVSVDMSDQTLMGHSLGGLTTLHALFRRTSSFQHFVAIAPSIWYNNREVLDHEANFVERVRAGATEFWASRGMYRSKQTLPIWHLDRPELRIAVVAHAGTNGVLLCQLLGLDPVPWEWDRFVIQHASVSRLHSFELGDGHSFSLTRLSDTEFMPVADRSV